MCPAPVEHEGAYYGDKHNRAPIANVQDSFREYDSLDDAPWLRPACDRTWFARHIYFPEWMLK